MPRQGRIAIASWCLLVAISTSTAHAEQRIALVVGNGDYSAQPLGNPPNDAALMAETLRDVGFEVIEQINADSRTLKRAVHNFSKLLNQSGEDAVGLVYYSGHGIQSQGENYMIPVDAQIEDAIDVEFEGFPASTLLKALGNAGNRLNIVIMDACRNNPYKAATRSGGTGLARMDAPFGTLIAYSTAPGKVAADGKGRNSPYTRALARAIKTPGAKVEDVFKKVRIAVMDRTNDAQVPWESSSLTGDFYFVDETPAATPKPAEVASIAPSNTNLEIEYWKSIANSENPDLFQGYIDRFPDGIFISIAEERVEQLTTTSPASNQQAETVYFQSIQNSANAADFDAYLSAYPKGTFAGIAKQRIKTLRTRESQRTLDQNRIVEKQLWDEVKTSDDPALVETFLREYPNSIYAALAKTRLDSLKAKPPTETARPVPAPSSTNAQVAAASPAIVAAPGMFWRGAAKTKGASHWTVSWCGYSEELQMALQVNGTKATGSIKTTRGFDIPINGTFSGGVVRAKMSIQGYRFQLRGAIRDGKMIGKVFNTDSAQICQATFTLDITDQ